MQLLELAVDIRLHRGVADVGVDLDAGHLADRHRIEPLLQMIDVGGNDEPPNGDLVANGFDRERFPFGDALHLGCARALAGEEHLGAASHTELPSPVRTGSGSKGVISACDVRRHPCNHWNVTGSKLRAGVVVRSALWACGASPIQPETRMDRARSAGPGRGCHRDDRARAGAAPPSALRGPSY